MGNSFRDFNQLFDGDMLWNMEVCQNLVPLVNIKIAGKWMFIFIPLKMVLIGIDPYPNKRYPLFSRKIRKMVKKNRGLSNVFHICMCFPYLYEFSGVPVTTWGNYVTTPSYILHFLPGMRVGMATSEIAGPNIWWFPYMVVPKNGWFIRENPIKNG